MEKISVVIPVYNVEKYLSKCLDSVINQTYKNLQIVLVDDGSTDSSGKICDEYAEQDNRITVIHQKNAGAGAAKNAGLDLINGDYFSIIDSDDYIELDMYEKMIYSLKKNNVDIVQCLFRNIFVNGNYNRKYKIKGSYPKKLSTKNFLKEYLYDWKYAIFCNKIFKTSLLKDIRFPVGRKIDDEFFTYKVVCNAKNIVNIEDILYNYRMRKTSVMNENASDRLIYDRIDCFIERCDYIKKHYPSLSRKYQFKLYDLLQYYESQLNDTGKLERYIEKLKLPKATKFDTLADMIQYKKLINDFNDTSNSIKFD